MISGPRHPPGAARGLATVCTDSEAQGQQSRQPQHHCPQHHGPPRGKGSQGSVHPGELHPEDPLHLQPPAQRHPGATPLHRELTKQGLQLTKLPQTPQQTQRCTEASMVLKRIPRRNTQQEEAEKGAFQDLTSINGKH